jgi:hypothetical protein
MRPTILSWGLLAVAACGKVSANADAAGNGIDAMASPDADPHGVVTVTVLNTDQSGTPVQGVPVVFFDPDGTMVGQSDSDAQGKASATVLPGANVSVVWPKSATEYLVSTVYEIKPGDDLVLGFRNPSKTDVATFQVSYDAFSGASYYEIFGPCGQADASNILHFQAGCKTDPFDLYVLAFASSGALMGSNAKTGVAISSGSVHLPSTGWNFSGQFTASYTNVPSIVTNVTVDHVSGFPGGYDSGGNGTPDATAHTASLAFTTPTVGTNAWVQSQFQGPTGSAQLVRQRIAGASTTAGMDVTATLLPWLDTPTFDAATQHFTMTAQSTGTYDMYFSELEYTRTSGSTTTNFTWVLVGPTIGTITLPTLPSDVGNVNPLTTDTISGMLTLLIDDDGNGWDSVRARTFDEFFDVIEGRSTSQQERVSITQPSN